MTNTNETTYQNYQIYRADGKGKFVETLSRSFDIGKVILNFVEYDDTKEAGNRITSQVAIYMDFPKFRAFAQDMISGRFLKLAEKNKGKPVYEDLTGTSAERLKTQNRARKDGKAESRRFSLTMGTKGFFFTAEAGPGEETETGLIKPAGKAEKRISVILDPQHCKELVLTTLASIDHYLIAKETVRQFEEIRQSLLQPKGKTA